MNQATSEFRFLPYWHAKPKRIDLMFVSLLLPALAWVMGFILLTGPVYVSASRLNEYDQQRLGSWLMVIGGEVGTLAASAEVFRKQRQGSTNTLDWVGMGISLTASLATALSLFVKQTQEPWTWVHTVRPALPLVLRVASVFDFYANSMELGFYITHYGERMESWEEGKHAHLMRERNRYQEWLAAQESRSRVEVRLKPHKESVESRQESEEASEESGKSAWKGWDKMNAKERILLLAQERPNLTQAQIAETALCSEGYVSKVLNGVS